MSLQRYDLVRPHCTSQTFSGAEGGHCQGGHSQGGHSQGGHCQGGHSQGGHCQGGHCQGGHCQGGHCQGTRPQWFFYVSNCDGTNINMILRFTRDTQSPMLRARF